MTGRRLLYFDPLTLPRMILDDSKHTEATVVMAMFQLELTKSQPGTRQTQCKRLRLVYSHSGAPSALAIVDNQPAGTKE